MAAVCLIWAAWASKHPHNPNYKERLGSGRSFFALSFDTRQQAMPPPGPLRQPDHKQQARIQPL